MVRVPATPLNMLILGVFFAGLGLYMLARAAPAYVEHPDGGLLFLLIVGPVFVLIGAAWFWRVVAARRRGSGWLQVVARKGE